MNAIKEKITGGAYDKPAKTQDGAMTTADAANAHTIEGTSSDPNAEGSAGIYEKGEQMAGQAKEAGYQAEAKVKEKAPDGAQEKMEEMSK
jgi:hypothetical protein